MKIFFVASLVMLSTLLADDCAGESRCVSESERIQFAKERVDRERAAKARMGGSVACNPFSYSENPQSLHTLFAVSQMGDMVELIEGSRWIVEPYDRHKMYAWKPHDKLVIRRNSAWGSSYPYTLHNVTINDVIRIVNSEFPLQNSPYTRWIVFIDPYNQLIVLNDGSQWTVFGSDWNIYKYWKVNDTVLIGTNSGFFAYLRPNILINFDTKTDIDARWIY